VEEVIPQQAARCWALASEVTNPALKECLVETAQRWSRLATDLEAMHILVEEWRQEDQIDDSQEGRLGPLSVADRRLFIWKTAGLGPSPTWEAAGRRG
jgi:hypothetical protein